DPVAPDREPLLLPRLGFLQVRGAATRIVALVRLRLRSPGSRLTAHGSRLRGSACFLPSIATMTSSVAEEPRDGGAARVPSEAADDAEAAHGGRDEGEDGNLGARRAGAAGGAGGARAARVPVDHGVDDGADDADPEEGPADGHDGDAG